MIDEKYTIVKEENFIKATRDSGYKSTASAISEIADNGFQAGANNFAVYFKSEKPSYSGRGKPPSPKVVEVICVDDGSGMSSDILRTALRFGGTTRFDDRDGLGRYGMGLPNSSASQCRRLEVFTWQHPEKVYFSYIDIDEVVAGDMLIVPEPAQVTIPKEYQEFMKSETGTIVVWKKCDRLDDSGREDTLTKKLPMSLGQAYRYYLVRGKRINVNGRDVKPFDPLFLMSEAERKGAGEHGEPIRFDIKVPGNSERTVPVVVKFSLLPEKWQAKFGRSKKKLREHGLDRARGFSVIRCGREIDMSYFRLRSKHWTDHYWSCEISFEPELDELFGVTHTKQQIKLSERIRTTIEKDINANITTLVGIIVERGTKRHRANTKKAEEIAKESDKFLRTSPEIRDKSAEVVEQEMREYAEEKATEDSSVEEVMNTLRDRPFLLDFENLPGAPFYRVRTYGKTTVVTLNREHTFFDKLYSPLCDSDPTSKTGVELLLFALAKAETLASNEGILWYKTQRHEWSQILAAYFDGLELLDGFGDNGHGI